MNPLLFKLMLGLALSLNGVHAFAAGSKGPAVDPLEEDWSSNSSEVPIESIQQFVQIYGTVKENYVIEVTDDQLFLQAIQGLVSGLDRYSRYLSPDDYRQLLKYTEEDLASIDFDLSFDTSRGLWQIENLDPDSDSAKLGLANGVTLYKLMDKSLDC